jgi:EAL domain
MTARRFLDLVAQSSDQWVGVILNPSRPLDPGTTQLTPDFTAKIMKLAGDNGGKVQFTEDLKIILFLRKTGTGGLDGLDDMIRRACQDPMPITNAKGAAVASYIMVPVFYNLSQSLAAFTAAVEQLTGLKQNASELASRAARQTVATLKLSSHVLGQVEAALPFLDLPSLLRHQWVCALIAERAPMLIYREQFVSIDALRDAAAPDVDLRSDRGLFHALLSHLDMLAIGALIGTDRPPDTNFGLNLTCKTVLTPLFSELAELFADSNNDLIVELQAHELLADTTGFANAVRVVKNIGHKVCLDGLTDHGASLIRLDRIDVDFFKIIAPPPAFTAGEITASIADKLGKLDPTKVILARCEKEHQVKAGQAAGIVLFQGWHADALARTAEAAAKMVATS